MERPFVKAPSSSVVCGMGDALAGRTESDERAGVRRRLIKLICAG